MTNRQADRTPRSEQLQLLPSQTLLPTRKGGQPSSENHATVMGRIVNESERQ
jgi:hypothetical protein